MHQIVRRSLLAAGGTLLAGAVARKYLVASPVDAEEAAPPPPALVVHAPAPLPALRFTTADGAVHALADYAGRGVVLNFWATWCIPCVSEMPALDALSHMLDDRHGSGQADMAGAAPKNASPGGSGIAVLAVSVDHGGAGAVQPFYASHGIHNLPVLLDPHAEAMMALKLDGVPTTLVIDRKGREVARVQGAYPWGSNETARTIRGLVG